MQRDDTLDIYSAIVNSSIRSSAKNRVIEHIEQIRIAQRLDSIKLLLYVLTKLHYEDYIKAKGLAGAMFWEYGADDQNQLARQLAESLGIKH